MSCFGLVSMAILNGAYGRPYPRPAIPTSATRLAEPAYVSLIRVHTSGRSTKLGFGPKGTVNIGSREADVSSPRFRRELRFWRDMSSIFLLMLISMDLNNVSR